MFDGVLRLLLMVGDGSGDGNRVVCGMAWHGPGSIILLTVSQAAKKAPQCLDERQGIGALRRRLLARRRRRGPGEDERGQVFVRRVCVPRVLAEEAKGARRRGGCGEQGEGSRHIG